MPGPVAVAVEVRSRSAEGHQVVEQLGRVVGTTAIDRAEYLPELPGQLPQPASLLGIGGRVGPAVTTTWLDRWDAQQETYLPEREERFEVLVDLLEATAGPRPRVLDLACGPASLALRVLARLPEASVVGVDTDPVLLALARAAGPASLELVDADLRRPDWTERISAGPYDAVLSTTALHWLEPDALRSVYAACARLLRPGGLLANGDHLNDLENPKLVELARELDRRRTERHTSDGEDWAGWWDAIRADPELSQAVAERDRLQFEHPAKTETNLAVHEGALRDAGFGEVGVLWRKGTNAVLAALR
ncbi:MAG: class I SAM-dependent methyltransferase [Solirubrobacteraceae bacterium]